MSISPYPIDRFDSLSAAEASVLSAWARSADLAAFVSGGVGAQSWLGVPLEVRPGAPHTTSEPIPSATDPTIVLESGHRAALMLEGPIASVIVERTLGGEAELDPVVGPFGEVELGVLHYAVSRWLREGESHFRAATAFAHPAAALASLAEGPTLRWPLQLTVGSRSGRALLILPASARPHPRRRKELPSFCAAVVVEAIAEAGHATLRASEIAGLRPSDIVLPDRLDLDAIHLRPKNGSPMFRCRLSSDGLEIRQRLGHSGPTIRPGKKENRMSDAPIESMSEVPVTLTIELARLTLPLGEIASLAVGEIVRANQPIGRDAILRAGDQIVARGELVEVDGELGVRILEVTTD